MEGGPRSKLVNLAIAGLVLGALAVAVVFVLRMDPSARRGKRTGRRYADQAREAGIIDAARIAWRELSPPLALELEDPRGLAVDAQDRILVAGERLLALDRDGQVLGQSADLGATARAVAVGEEGRLHLVFPREIVVLRSVEALSEVVERREIDEPGTDLASITVTPLGVFVADAGQRRILRLLAGTPPHEVFARGFHVPSCFELARTPAGDVVTVDPGRHQVQVRSAYGDVVRSFGRHGEKLEDFHGCCNPTAIARLADGRTVTAEKGLAATRIKVYGESGKLESVVAGPQAFDHRPEGPPIELDVAVDSRGRILVLDPSRRQVRVFVRRVAPGEKESGK